MNYIYSGIYFFVFFFLIGLSAISMKEKHSHGIKAFSMLSISMAIYAGGSGFEIISTSLENILTWVKVEYVGYAFLPLLIFYFITYYVGSNRLINKIIMIFLGTTSFVTLILVITNDMHHFYYKSTGLDYSQGFPLLSKVYGPWFYVHISLQYICLTYAIIRLIILAKKTRGKNRRRNLIIILGFAVPAAFAVAYNLNVFDTYLDFVPLSFLVTAILATIGLYVYRTALLAEVTFENIYNYLRIPLIVLDSEGYLVKINSFAKQEFQELGNASTGDHYSNFKLLLELSKNNFNLEQFEHEEKFYYSRTENLKENDSTLIIIYNISGVVSDRKKLEEYATIDPLTGLYNRRYFMDRFNQIHDPGCIAFLDFDDFKSINDNFGHIAGDQVLADFGAFLKKQCPEVMACKYGGDEFLLSMSNIGLDDFNTKILQFIEAYKKYFTSMHGNFSVGICEYIPGDFEESVSRTDKLLYQAKELGKSKIVSCKGKIYTIK